MLASDSCATLQTRRRVALCSKAWICRRCNHLRPRRQVCVSETGRHRDEFARFFHLILQVAHFTMSLCPWLSVHHKMWQTDLSLPILYSLQQHPSCQRPKQQTYNLTASSSFYVRVLQPSASFASPRNHGPNRTKALPDPPALAGTCILPNVTSQRLGAPYQVPRAPQSSASAGAP